MKTKSRAIAALAASFALVGAVLMAALPATSVLADNTLGVSAGSTGGELTSSPAGIDCGDGHTACYYDFGTSATSVTLTAAPDSGKVANWSPTNCQSSTATTCVISVNNTTSATVYWDYPNYTIALHFEGSGSGTVTSSVGGASCSSSCTASVPDNSSPILTATPASGSVFAGWDYANANGATICNYNFTTQPNSLNTSSTCAVRSYTYTTGGVQNIGTAMPIFNAASSSSSGSSSSGSSSRGSASSGSSGSGSTAHGTTGSASASVTQGSITLPSSLGLSLWNGADFGQSGQTLSSSKSSSAQVGIATNGSTPLALVDVNLSNPVDWTKSKITYASSNTDHKAFVHGLTSAPDVVGGTFTLYVPYGNGDKYVGICPGAGSLSALVPSCPELYYLTNGQSLTHKDDSNIPANDTVTASIVTINNVKYWAISGLTGTGGFSSATNKIVKAAASGQAATMQANPKGSSGGVYAAIAVVVVILLGLGGTYKLWLPRVKPLISKRLHGYSGGGDTTNLQQ